VDDAPKRTYHAPELHELGSVSELTETSNKTPNVVDVTGYVS
jgi:hypothetical protein